jgi:predicted nucleotidyltransferase
MEQELSTLLDGRRIDLVTPKSLNHRIRDRILASAEVQYDAEGENAENTGKQR